ncbi:MAG TPA: succinate dehydrogenase [Candidatus Eisenbacteria bacterium]|jgi:succinate dehydrogenase / fumarate reductase cytochrome b subunit
MKVSDRTYFTLRRLHSLTGVVPIGLFLLEHLYTNARSLQGPVAFDAAVADLARLPFVVVIEALGIWLPIAFHMVLGVLIATTGQANVGKFAYPRNWQYALQRASGILLVFYLLYHTWALRFDKAYLNSSSAYAYVNHHLANPAVLAFYVLGTVAACYHFGNGLFGFAIHWGLVTGRGAQRQVARLGLAVTLALSVLGVGSLLGFRGFRANFLQKPHAAEHGSVVLERGSR